MWKFLLMFVLITGSFLTGCSNGILSGAKPPKAFLKIEGTEYETDLGSYCWKNACVDTARGVERLKGKEPIIVKPGQTISFVVKYEPKPNQSHLFQFSNGQEEDITVEKNHFSAPTETGVYYYSFGVGWMDEEDEHLSHGDASYGFVIEVE